MSALSKRASHNKETEWSSHIGLLLLPAFNCMAVNAFIDPLRAANYLRGFPVYTWDFLSLKGNSVTASNGMVLGETVPFDSYSGEVDFLVVNASWTPEKFQDPILQKWLRDHAHAGKTLIGIDTGAFVLAYAALLEDYRAAVHHEHIDSLRELFPATEVVENLYVIDRNRISCSGGFAAADLALEIIRLQHGMALADAAARYIFHERQRGSEEKQRSLAHEPFGQVVPEVVQDVLLQMEQNLEEVVPLPELARRAGVSQRQLERLFHKYIGETPKRHYVNIRLNRARSLLTQTNLSVAEIASACGFNSTEHFARAYKAQFNTSPSRDREEGRIPFQFRHFSGNSNGSRDQFVAPY